MPLIAQVSPAKRTISPSAYPESPRIDDQNHLPLSALPSSGQGSPIICILDTGISKEIYEKHRNKFVAPPYSVFTKKAIEPEEEWEITNVPSDDPRYCHGTKVFSIMATMNPNARFAVIKVFSEKEDTIYTLLRHGIVYATECGYPFVNLSLEIPASILKPIQTKGLKDAIEHLCDRGAYVFVASGNQGTSMDGALVPAQFAGSTDTLMKCFCVSSYNHLCKEKTLCKYASCRGVLSITVV